MKIKFRAEETGKITANVGDIIYLESLRQAVIPPYLMLMPFCDLPGFIELVETNSLGEDGIHGVTYVLKVKSKAEGQLVVGFKDMQTGKITHQKEIICKIEG